MSNRWSRNMRGMTASIASWTFLLVIWFLVSVFTHESIPSPYEVLLALLRLISDGELIYAVADSVLRVMTGFTFAVALGVIIGLAGLACPFFREMTYPIISFVVVTPSFAFVPLLMLVVGLNEWLVFWVVVICVSFPIAYALYGSIKSIDPSLVDAAKVCGASKSDIIFYVVLPLAITHVFALLKVEAGHAWRMVFVTEYLALTSGLGGLMIRAYALMRMDEVLALVIVLGGLALATQKLLEGLENALLSWRGRARL